MQMALVLATSP